MASFYFRRKILLIILKKVRKREVWKKEQCLLSTIWQTEVIEPVLSTTNVKMHKIRLLENIKFIEGHLKKIGNSLGAGNKGNVKQCRMSYWLKAGVLILEIHP